MRAAFEEVGISLARRDVLHGPFDFATGHRGAHELLQRPDAPALLVCANDVVALGALNAAAELGIDVPGQVSVVGFDDLPTSRWALVRLSTVAYDLDAMSREAARLIVRRVEGGPDEPVRRVAFDTRWVPRATVGRRLLRRAAPDRSSDLPLAPACIRIQWLLPTPTPGAAARPIRRKRVHAAGSHRLPPLRRSRRVHP